MGKKQLIVNSVMFLTMDCQGLIYSFIQMMQERIVPRINPLPSDKIFDETTLKALADNKLSIAKTMISIID